MKCSNCKSERILCINANHADRASFKIGECEKVGYAPKIDNICGGDNTFPDICLDCGQTQGTFPKPIVDSIEGPHCECDEKQRAPVYYRDEPPYCAFCGDNI